jgi:hypothetical protein
MQLLPGEKRSPAERMAVVGVPERRKVIVIAGIPGSPGLEPRNNKPAGMKNSRQTSQCPLFS